MPLPSDFGKRISQCDDDCLNPDADDRFGARSCLALVTATVQRHVHRRAAGAVPGSRDGFDFGVRTAESLMPALCDQIERIVDEHSADGRIGFDRSDSPGRELKRAVITAAALPNRVSMPAYPCPGSQSFPPEGAAQRPTRASTVRSGLLLRPHCYPPTVLTNAAKAASRRAVGERLPK